jgi:hypothetical protein
MPLCFANNWAIPAASSGEEMDMEHCKVDQRAALDLEHSLGRCQVLGCAARVLWYSAQYSSSMVYVLYVSYCDSPLSAT